MWEIHSRRADKEQSKVAQGALLCVMWHMSQEEVAPVLLMPSVGFRAEVTASAHYIQ